MPVVRATLLIAILGLSGALVAAEPPSHKQLESAKNGKATQGDQDAPAPAPLVVEIKPPTSVQVETTTNEREAKEKAENDWWLVKATIWLAGVTTLLAVFTFALWLATYRLAQDSEENAAKQSADMQESLDIAKVGVDASRRSSEAAEQTVRTMEDTAERQLRAYVGPDAFYLDLPAASLQTYVPVEPIAGKPISDFVTVRVKNFGQTPATKVRVWVNWVFTKKGFRLPLDFAFADEKQIADEAGVGFIVSNRLLFPDQIFVSKTPILDARNFLEATAGKADLFIYGHIDYRDVYGRDQVTKFCYIYEHLRAEGDRFVAHDQNNDAT